MKSRPFGKWSDLGVPQKGWRCTMVEDLGEPSAICEMCEHQEIRYVHHMEHPEYPHALEVGCVCAEKMEQDKVGPRKRENALKNTAKRRSNWLKRKWRTSAKGNAYLNTDGMNIVVFPEAGGLWSARIMERRSGLSESSRKRYASADAAKIAAFEAMVFLKETRRWGLK
ncbi:MAG: hypothetical protein ACPGOV_08640 [Magnetovibrionaceae bacterium]